MTHDTVTCGLCRRLADGVTHLPNGTEIPPLAECCGEHHAPDYLCRVELDTKRRCAVCGKVKAKRSFLGVNPWNTTAKMYGTVCLPCRRRRQKVREQIAAAPPSPMTDADWARLTGPTPEPARYGRKAGVRKAKWR